MVILINWYFTIALAVFAAQIRTALCMGQDWLWLRTLIYCTFAVASVQWFSMTKILREKFMPSVTQRVHSTCLGTAVQSCEFSIGLFRQLRLFWTALSFMRRRTQDFTVDGGSRGGSGIF